MTDSTESVRRSMIETGEPIVELALADQTWDTAELARDFEVLGFMAPFVVVRRRADGVKGSLMFTHSPRKYFSFTAD